MLRLLIVLAILRTAFAAPPAPSTDGKAIFATNCATCHKPGGENRTPVPEALARLPKDRIVQALETGVMKTQGARLTIEEKNAVADFLVAKNTDVPQVANADTCPSNPALRGIAGWNGWGVDLVNSRFQPGDVARLSATDVPNLKLKWAFGLPHTGIVYGQPTIADGRLFFGSGDGTVYSLDANTGCIYWTFKVPDTVRSAISLGRFGEKQYAAYFGDAKANVYAVDAQNGELLWKSKVDEHPWARVTGAPKLFNGRLYVPVSSVEELPAGDAHYACCSFRGSVVALDANTGEQIWKTYSIQDLPKETGKTTSGVAKFGPAGGAIWNSPTIDTDRKVLYVGTGNQYAEPSTKYSDAILAMDLETGALRWTQQMTPNDGWNFGCANPSAGSCPGKVGEDLDIGASPILRKLPGGRSLLIVSQKSGIVHALDPNKDGEIVWQMRLGKGGALGGIMWGAAANQDAVFVPLSDYVDGTRAKDGSIAGGGLFALKLTTGEKIWYVPPAKPECAGKFGCTPSQMAPATLIPGVVFSGSMDGHLRAYATADGNVIWDYDTLKPFDTVNGVKAKGGSLNATGPTVANGMLFVNSGYGSLGGMAGNVLLAFSAGN